MHLRAVVQPNNKLQQAVLRHTSRVSDLEAGVTNGFHNSSKIFVKYFQTRGVMHFNKLRWHVENSKFISNALFSMQSLLGATYEQYIFKISFLVAKYWRPTRAHANF